MRQTELPEAFQRSELCQFRFVIKTVLVYQCTYQSFKTNPSESLNLYNRGRPTDQIPILQFVGGTRSLMWHQCKCNNAEVIEKSTFTFNAQKISRIASFDNLGNIRVTWSFGRKTLCSTERNN